VTCGIEDRCRDELVTHSSQRWLGYKRSHTRWGGAVLCKQCERSSRQRKSPGRCRGFWRL